jgi:threonine/homoserine/homoserine lactone efflux protein
MVLNPAANHGGCFFKVAVKSRYPAMNKPPLLFVIFGIVGFAYAHYIFYQIWFEPRKNLKQFRERYYKLPDWFPFRGLLITLANDEKVWITLNKIMSVFAEIFMIFWLGLVLIAWFTGK